MIVPFLLSFLLFTIGMTEAAETIKASERVLPQLKPLSSKPQKKLRRKSGEHWEYRFSATPSLEYIGGSPEQAKRAGLNANFHYVYGSWRFYSEGFLEADGAKAAKLRRSTSTTALQEAYLEYKTENAFIKVGRQSLRWSEAWTLPSLDGWTARRFNRLLFDPLSEQLIHPTGVLLNWNSTRSSMEFFQNFLPATSIYPKPIPKTEEAWRSEWGAHAKYRFKSGLDTDITYFDKVDRKLYGASFNYATNYFVPKLEVGQDTKQTQFGILGLDFFYEKFSLIPRFTFYKRRPLINTGDNSPDSGKNYHLTIRWDNTSTWCEAQTYYDSLDKAQFYSLRAGQRFGPGLEISAMLQNYAGADNTLFGLYEDMTGGTVIGTKLAMTL